MRTDALPTGNRLSFSENNVALKNFYLLMQIGHVFSQRLWAVLTETVIDEARLWTILGTRIQIRFEAG